MTPDEFKSAQANLGFTNPQMADLLCCTLSMVEKMRSGTREVSAARAKKITTEILGRGHDGQDR